MKKNILTQNVHKTYFRILLLTLISHILFTATFGFLHILPMMAYNIFSVAFYCVMGVLLHKKYYSFVVTSIHLEIALFVSVTTMYVGWEPGYSFYLIALCSLVYFCPYANIHIPYFFSFAEVLLFVLLKAYSYYHKPIIPITPDFAVTVIYTYNALACFAVIIFAAFISNLSSLFAQRELLERNHNLQNLLNHDDLTRLYTRAYLKEKFQESLRQSKSAFLIMADIDDFKYINDTYGHPCGDYVLFTLSTIMKTVCPPDADISRWGGEEFVIAIYGNTKEIVKDHISRLKDTISAYNFEFEGNKFHITVTFGISSTEEYSNFEKLICLADERMYHGKKSGKNMVILSGEPNTNL